MIILYLLSGKEQTTSECLHHAHKNRNFIVMIMVMVFITYQYKINCSSWSTFGTLEL